MFFLPSRDVDTFLLSPSWGIADEGLRPYSSTSIGDGTTGLVSTPRVLFSLFSCRLGEAKVEDLFSRVPMKVDQALLVLDIVL